MKTQNALRLIAVAALALWAGHFISGKARAIPPGPQEDLAFSPVGIVEGQTARLNVSSLSPAARTVPACGSPRKVRRSNPSDRLRAVHIANLGGKLYVTYAQQDGAQRNGVSGPGHGFIDVYSLDGTLLHRLVTRGDLDSPWGLVIATHHFGQFSDDLLLGNFGDGTIHAYDATTGAALGALTNPDGDQIQINGLWSLIYGDKSAGTAIRSSSPLASATKPTDC